MLVWVWGWLEACRFLQTVPGLVASNLEQLDLGLQAGLVQSRPDGCQFGFGDGSRPFVSLDGALTGCFQS